MPLHRLRDHAERQLPFVGSDSSRSPRASRCCFARVIWSATRPCSVAPARSPPGRRSYRAPSITGPPLSHVRRFGTRGAARRRPAAVRRRGGSSSGHPASTASAIARADRTSSLPANRRVSSPAHNALAPAGSSGDEPDHRGRGTDRRQHLPHLLHAGAAVPGLPGHHHPEVGPGPAGVAERAGQFGDPVPHMVQPLQVGRGQQQHHRRRPRHRQRRVARGAAGPGRRSPSPATPPARSATCGHSDRSARNRSADSTPGTTGTPSEVSCA